MNKGYIKIENDGVIDSNALFLLGATSKRGDNSKIGYFGSGLKYALAVLLKNGIEFKIFAGEKEIKISTVKEDFRGTSFDVIKIDNKKTSFTTDMGPDWKAWFAIRELYCNAIDEGSHSMGISNEPKGQEGKTAFFVKFDDRLNELFNDWNKFFSDKREDIEADIAQHGVKMFSGNQSELIVYRRGVQVMQEKKKCLYHYDLNWVKINESRVIESSWDLHNQLAKYLGVGAPLNVVRNILDNYQGTFEEDLYWDYVNRFSDTWLDAIGSRKIIIDSVAGYFIGEIAENKLGTLVLPAKLANSLKSYFGKRIHVMGLSDMEDEGVKLKLSDSQTKVCLEAVTFLKKAGIEVTQPIELCEFDNKNVLGKAKDGKILIAPRCFDLGRRQVTMTVLEEYSHLESGHSDETRAFQNFLFNKWVNLLEEKAGETI